jgi:hypothetical protein
MAERNQVVSAGAKVESDFSSSVGQMALAWHGTRKALTHASRHEKVAPATIPANFIDLGGGGNKAASDAGGERQATRALDLRTS